ncbi:MAG: hydantoinase/carbamoylase family amidase [Alphaproteobacteria bacterium]|nr:hydantoinase/carbamoylase family amidase [Alphaproteobacteria bacterium]
MAIQDPIGRGRTLAESLFDQLRRDGADHPGVTRDPYGPGEQRAHATIGRAARDLGLAVTRDAAANTYMTWPGRNRAAKRIVIGSHLDSVPHGGNFDGAAGVVGGLVAIDALQRAGFEPESDIVVMAIRAEESVWFEVSYIGSRAALGALPEGALAAKRRDTARPLAAHIADCGGDPAILVTGRPQLEPSSLRAYLEIHIEQAPSLVEADKPVAICTGIPGNFRFPDARIEGAYDHVGLPRRFRRDAALAGADFFVAMDRLWEDYEQRGIPMACTIGRFHTDPAAHGMTIIPGEFRFSLDVRAYDEAVLLALEDETNRIINETAHRRQVRFHLGPRARAAVGPVDHAIAASLLSGAAALGIPVIELGSPASHDAAAFAAAGVPMGMIFVRNTNGSHNPHEAMAIDDFLAATSLLGWWLESNAAISSGSPPP